MFSSPFAVIFFIIYNILFHTLTILTKNMKIINMNPPSDMAKCSFDHVVNHFIYSKSNL